jgi:hypothetical protein
MGINVNMGGEKETGKCMGREIFINHGNKQIEFG